LEGVGGDVHALGVPVGVNVEVSPLDHVEAGLTKEVVEGLDFGGLVGKAWQSEIVDRDPFP
jgi:hypothetical protein